MSYFQLIKVPNSFGMINLKSAIALGSIEEFDILELLSANPHKVYSRNEIIDRIHGIDTIITERAIDVHIRNLRKKLGQHSAFIQSAWGRGYVFRDDALIK